MKRSLVLGSLAVLVLTHLAGGAPLTPFADQEGFRRLAFEPFHSQTVTLKCKGKERTSIIVYGQGSTPMAVYVFDAFGNCIAKDDVSLTTVSDDLAVDWYPAAEAAFDVEIRNLGRKVNNAEIVIR